ncbi:MAG TPA: hypothetical protein VH302_06600 [Bryobacteraceae bacterium]|nr:hypothetical protein [Bryobacteraceae bacterium]
MEDPMDPKEDPKPTETEVKNKPEDQKHLDRDGGERQPSDVSNQE